MIFNRKKRIIKKTLVLFVFFAVIFFPFENIFAVSIIKSNTKPLFEIIDRNSGLSNLSVSSIVQDKDGFLWFGTQEGLNSFDGRKMTIYKNNPFEDDGLVHNLIQTMYYDEKEHDLWIGTYQGVSRFHIHNKTFENYTVEDDGLSNPVVISIIIDNNDDVWFGTMDGLNKMNPDTGVIKKYKIPGNYVRSLDIDSRGRLLIASYEGLHYYDENTDNIKNFNLDLPSSYVMFVKEFEEGTITLGLWDGGVVKYNLDTGKVNVKKYKDNRVYSIFHTNDGTEWVGTWGGGLFADTSGGERYHFPGKDEDKSLANPIVYSMLQDDSDILWIGTNGGGINKINPRKSNYVQFSYDPEDPESLSAGKINSIFRDSRNNLWIAVYYSGLNRYIPSEDKIIKYKHDDDNPDSLPDDYIKDIYETGDGRLLFATGSGLAYFNYENDTFKKCNILPEEMIVYSIAEDSDSNLWIGTYRNGIYQYDRTYKKLKQFKANSSEHSLSDNLVYDFLIDSKKRLWVATNNGLNLLKAGEDKFQIFRRESGNYNQLGSNTILALHEDSKGRIWIGLSGGGIAIYNEDGTFTSFLESDGMTNNLVTGILEDNIGRIWAATHNGISIIKAESGEINILSPEDGIGGREFNSGYFKDHDDTLLFGGIHGITGIPTNFADIELKAPRVYITDISLFQESIEPHRTFFNDLEYKFDYNDSFLAFEFVALDYDSPGKILYSYKLKGFDDEWIHTGTRNYVSYSNLPAGNYEFMVVAETARGVISESESVFFTIEKPWFKTNLAYLMYGLGFILLILALLKIREGFLLNQKNSELARINSKLEEANETLENLSIKDHLTGLYNRRYFNTKIDELLNLAKRSGTYLTLMMLDVDRFKSINDNFGHLAGDYFLKDIGERITQELSRSTDFVSRFGGDEFAIILYDTSPEGARMIAEKIKEAVEDISVRSDFSSWEVKTTISMGLCSVIPEKNISSREIISATDDALYKAKQEGRDRICEGKINHE